MSLFLIGYDISNERRIAQIFRRLKNHAIPIQYSLFLLDGSEKNLQCCLDEIIPIINSNEDDLRCYPLPARGLKIHMGKALLPDGIILNKGTNNI